MIQHPAGDYSFVPGIAPYSCGVISQPGFEIVHVTLKTMIDWRSGFDRIAETLKQENRRRPHCVRFHCGHRFRLHSRDLLPSMRNTQKSCKAGMCS